MACVQPQPMRRGLRERHKALTVLKGVGGAYALGVAEAREVEGGGV